MIFKRNAKGLLEREVTTPPMQETVHFTPAPNNMARQEMQRSSPVLNQERKELPVSSLSSSMTPSYPQEDFPSYAHGNQEPAANEYMQDMEQTASEHPETTLGEGVSFKGELAFKRYLCINGEFEGVLSSNGKLRVGKSGFVKSNLKLKSAIIEGRVEGDIVVEDLLELRGSACVKGNITARYLRVDDGVTLTGHVSICPEGQQAAAHGATFEAQS